MNKKFKVGLIRVLTTEDERSASVTWKTDYGYFPWNWR